MDKLILEEILGETIVSQTSVGGGNIADSRMVLTSGGSRYFLKQGLCNDVFRAEAEGLRELSLPGCLRVPGVISVGENFLLLEAVVPGLRGEHFFEAFGRALALMHRFSAHQFGFKHDNYIGTTPQVNRAEGEECHDWAAFYWEKRLLFQFRLCEKNGYADHQLSELFAGLESIYPNLMNGSQESPALLHGDLWYGNFLCDTDGQAVLIDPAVYYGHREADLAMTKLFGGFSNEFYVAYQEEFPLLAGAERREPLYLLYHVLNHLNLFGTTYYGRAIDLLERLIKQSR